METRRPEIIFFPTFRDERGSLSVMEKNPFEVKRVFWIYEATKPRGQHSHKEGEQLIVAINGSFLVRVVMEDTEMEWKLTYPAFGLYLPPGAWVELDEFSDNAVALVLCSHYHDEDELC